MRRKMWARDPAKEDMDEGDAAKEWEREDDVIREEDEELEGEFSYAEY